MPMLADAVHLFRIGGKVSCHMDGDRTRNEPPNEPPNEPGLRCD